MVIILGKFCEFRQIFVAPQVFRKLLYSRKLLIYVRHSSVKALVLGLTNFDVRFEKSISLLSGSLVPRPLEIIRISNYVFRR